MSLDGPEATYSATPEVGASRTAITIGPGPLPDAPPAYQDSPSQNGPLQAGNPSNGSRERGFPSKGSEGLQGDVSEGGVDMFGEAESGVGAGNGGPGNSTSARASDKSRAVVRSKTIMRTLEPAGAPR